MTRRLFHAVRSWAYKWLPIIAGCHQRPDRSFFVNGRQFPVCARCTGELAGFVVAGVSAWLERPGIGWLVVAILPAIVDGAVQMATSYESNNWLRVVTGFGLGYGLIGLFVTSLVAAYQFGVSIGLQFA